MTNNTVVTVSMSEAFCFIEIPKNMSFSDIMQKVNEAYDKLLQVNNFDPNEYTVRIHFESDKYYIKRIKVSAVNKYPKVQVKEV